MQYLKNDPRWALRAYGTDSSILNNCMYIGTIFVSMIFALILRNRTAIKWAIFASGVSNILASLLSLLVIDLNTKLSPYDSWNELQMDSNRTK